MAFGDTLQGLLSTGVDIYKATTTPKAAQSNPVAANPVASPKTDFKQYLPWAIGAAVVLLLVVVFTGRRR